MKVLLRFSFSAIILLTLFMVGCSDPNSSNDPELQNQNLFKLAPVIEDLTSDLSLTGSGFISAGVGMFIQPATININVPNVTINQVLLYWAIRDTTTGDNTILVEGNPVVGEHIGGPHLSTALKNFSYRADITSLGVVSSNTNNSVDVDGLTADRTDGAAIVVVFDDGTDSYLEIRDGLDFAYYFVNPQLPELINTNEETFVFAPVATDRVADLTMLVGDVGHQNGSVRPHTITYEVGGVTTEIWYPFSSADGEQWDTKVFNINIPAGETELTVRLFSKPDPANSGLNPSSLLWIAAGLSVPIPEEGGCSRTPGYWKTHSLLGPAPYDDTWAILPNGHNTIFFLSGKTYYEAFWTSPSGNAYYILAHAYMAAKLNQLAGTSIPPAVLTAFNTATGLFGTYTPAQIGAMNGGNAVRQQFVSLAGILDDYNNGITGPGHCPD